MKKHILLAEPYFGGSHRAFLVGLQARLGREFNFTLLSLPARKWKMRMQAAAPWLAERIIELYQDGERFDGMLCSTFLDLAVLRSLLVGAGIHLPAAVYFHENQFAYPGRIRDPGYFQFTNINWTTGLCADLLAFNSRFNYESFLSGISKFITRVSDISLADTVERIRAKSRILHPGIDFSQIDSARPQAGQQDMPVVLWNHRWEHDKDPETFFQALFALDTAGIDFGLIILGQHFSDQPAIFDQARRRLGRRILHCGYVQSRTEYAYLLHQADLVVSTAVHEFFGMAVLEATRAGCRPLVPDRLAYVELYPARFRYEPANFLPVLRSVLADLPDRQGRAEYRKLAAPFAWSALVGKYSAWLHELCDCNTFA